MGMFDDIIEDKPAVKPKRLFDDILMPDESAPQKVARSLLMGIPFSDRAMAGMQTAHDYLTGGGKDYAGNLEDVRAANERLSNEHPIGAFAGSLVGGAVMPMGILAKAATVPATLGARSLLMGGSGVAVGALGGLSGSRDLTDPGETAQSTVRGAGMGGLLGAAIPPVGAGIGRVVGSVSMRRAPGAEGMSRPATNFLVDEMNAEGGANALRSEAMRLGDNAMLTDLGPAMTGLGQATAIASSEGRKAMNDALKARSAGAADRITKTADEALGLAVPPRVADAGIRAARSKRDRVNYTEALRPNATVDGPPPIDTANVVRFVNNALPRAEGDEKSFLERFGKSLFKPNPDLIDREMVRLKMPSERVLGARDQAIAFGGVKDDRGDLEDLIKAYKGLGKPGGMSPDYMREALAEQGYFDHIYGSRERAVAESTPQDLFDVLDSNRIRNEDLGLQAEIDAAAEQRAKLKEQARTGGETPDVVPKTEAENLHKIKTDLDRLLSGQPAFNFGPGLFSREDATIAGARKRLNTELERQVPGYERANRVSEQYAKRGEALDIGQKALGSGPSAPWPQELEASIAPMSKKERSALKIGARGVIGERLGHQINDLRAGESVLKGENDFNRANAEMIFGKDAVDTLANRLASERQFKATENAVIGNSATAQRQQALSKYKAIPLDLPPHTKTGMATQVVAGLLNRVLPDKTKYAGEVGGLLTRQGNERDAVIDALSQWIAEQEARRQGGARKGQSVSRGLLAPLLGRPSFAGPSGQQDR